MNVFVPAIYNTQLLHNCLEHIKNAIPNAKIQVLGADRGNIGQTRSFMCNTIQDQFFCMIDSDILLPKDWLKQVTKYMKPDVGAVFCKKLSAIPKLREFELYSYAQQAYPAINSGRLDTACTLIRSKAVKGFHTETQTLEDLLLGEYIIRNGYKHIMIDYTVLHLGYGGFLKGYYKALRKDGNSLHYLKKESLFKIGLSMLVMPLKQKRFRLFTFKYKLMLLTGFLGVGT